MKTVESILRAQNAYGATFYDIGEHSPLAGIRAGVAAFDHATDFNVPSVSPVDPPKAAMPVAEPLREGSADSASEETLVEFLLGGNEAPARRARPSQVSTRQLPVTPLVPRRPSDAARASPVPSVSTPTSTSSQLPIASRAVGVGA